MAYPTEADNQAARYDPAKNNYRDGVQKDPRCLFGWGPPQRGCRHRFGHACFRALGHRGRCMDDPHDDSCAQAQRPADWDSKQREECNR